jgi:hypothetical protein
MVVTGDMRGFVENNGVFIVAMPPNHPFLLYHYSCITVVKLCQKSACNVQSSVL